VGDARSSTAITAKVNRDRREAFVSSNPGIEEALSEEHHILKDLANKLGRYGSLSPAQVALAHKIAREVKEKRRQPPEKLVPAPIADGRQTVRGRVVSSKCYESDFGISIRITVKIETPDGSWLAWGSKPNVAGSAIEVGDVVQFDARLKSGREPHFALFSRPTKAVIVDRKAVE